MIALINGKIEIRSLVQFEIHFDFITWSIPHLLLILCWNSNGMKLMFRFNLKTLMLWCVLLIKKKFNSYSTEKPKPVVFVKLMPIEILLSLYSVIIAIKPKVCVCMCVGLCVCLCVRVWKHCSPNEAVDFDETFYKRSDRYIRGFFFSDFDISKSMTLWRPCCMFYRGHSQGRNFCPIFFKFWHAVDSFTPCMIFKISKISLQLQTARKKAYNKRAALDFWRSEVQAPIWVLFHISFFDNFD